MKESNRIEFKTQLTDDLEKEVVAFLNYREGGKIYIGIADDGMVLGVDDFDAVQLKIKDRLKTNILPSCLGLFDVIHEIRDKKNIININIASGSDKPYYLKKRGMSEKGCFLRVGSAAEPMTVRQIEDLFAKRTRNSLSKIVSNRQDLTFEQLKIYYEAKKLKLTEKFAQNLELVTKNGEFNYVAYLFADENGTSIKVAKYSGTDRVDLIESNEYGYCSIIKATKSVLDKLELENKTTTKITSKERIETRLWNAIALREAVINAIIHNDYTREVPPKFEIFSDRLEITSYGGLFEGMTQDDFFDGLSLPRNKELMRIYKDLDMVEQLGSGVPRILQSYSRNCFKISDNYLRMSFPHSIIKNDQVNDQVSDQVSDYVQIGKYTNDLVSKVLEYAQANSWKSTEVQIKKYIKLVGNLSNEQFAILEFTATPKSNKEIQEECLKLKRHTDNFKRYIKPLLQISALKRTIPAVPKSRLQKYFSSEAGKIMLFIRKNA